MPPRRAQHILLAFLALSALVHAAVFGVFPEIRATVPPPVTLEVVLSRPEPLPVAPPEPEPPPPLKRKLEARREPEPAVAPAGKAVTPQPEAPAPVLALPSSEAPAERAFTLPAAKVPEPASPPAQKSQVAAVSVVPPTFNAAYLRNPAPSYPLAARRSGEQGTVTVRVLVSPEGLPARVDLEKSSGSKHLDNAAVEAVKGWRFAPARRGTEPVEGWVLVPIVFRLEG